MRSIFYQVLSLMILAPTVVWGGPASLVVHDTAMVRDHHIKLGDVATLSGSFANPAASLRDMVIAQSPPVGQERILYGEYVLTRLKQHGVNPEDVEIEVPDKIRITRASQHIEASEIEETVLRTMREAMSWETNHVDIRSLRGIEAVTLPSGPVRTEVTFPVNTDFLGPTSFKVSFYVSGNLEKRLYGSANLDVIQEVVTTKRILSRHDIITAADLQLSKVNLTRLPRQVFMKPEDVIGKRAKRDLQAHRMIHTNDVEALPLIRKGDVVLILVESPVLKVSTIGEALEHGKEGDTIRIRNVTSQRSIRAVVIDKKTVRVPF